MNEACQYPTHTGYHGSMREVDAYQYGARPLLLCPWHREILESRLWEHIASGMALLAVRRPSGDDAVYDYWPNALEAIRILYSALHGEGDGEIEDFYFHHLYESLPGEVAHTIIHDFRDIGWTVIDVDEDTADRWYSTWPKEQLRYA